MIIFPQRKNYLNGKKKVQEIQAAGNWEEVERALLGPNEGDAPTVAGYFSIKDIEKADVASPMKKRLRNAYAIYDARRRNRPLNAPEHAAPEALEEDVFEPLPEPEPIQPQLEEISANQSSPSEHRYFSKVNSN